MRMAISEEDLVASKKGKWSVAGVPHRGWVCVDIEDLGEPSIECDMSHDDYPDVLQVGCVCAGHMEGDLAASKAREVSMKSRSAKRKRWLSRAWKVSAKGNPYISADGYRIIVYQRGSG